MRGCQTGVKRVSNEWDFAKRFAECRQKNRTANRGAGRPLPIHALLCLAKRSLVTKARLIAWRQVGNYATRGGRSWTCQVTVGVLTPRRPSDDSDYDEHIGNARFHLLLVYAAERAMSRTILRPRRFAAADMRCVGTSPKLLGECPATINPAPPCHGGFDRRGLSMYTRCLGLLCDSLLATVFSFYLWAPSSAACLKTGPRR